MYGIHISSLRFWNPIFDLVFLYQNWWRAVVNHMILSWKTLALSIFIKNRRRILNRNRRALTQTWSIQFQSYNQCMPWNSSNFLRAFVKEWISNQTRPERCILVEYWVKTWCKTEEKNSDYFWMNPKNSHHLEPNSKMDVVELCIAVLMRPESPPKVVGIERIWPWPVSQWKWVTRPELHQKWVKKMMNSAQTNPTRTIGACTHVRALQIEFLNSVSYINHQAPFPNFWWILFIFLSDRNIYYEYLQI